MDPPTYPNIGRLNPIPTGHGQNQPIYEHQVTKSGRNRVKLLERGYFNSRLFNPRLFNPELSNPMVQKLVEKSEVGKFMVQKSGVERSGFEAWG